MTIEEMDRLDIIERRFDGSRKAIDELTEMYELLKYQYKYYEKSFNEVSEILKEKCQAKFEIKKNGFNKEVFDVRKTVDSLIAFQEEYTYIGENISDIEKIIKQNDEEKIESFLNELKEDYDFMVCVDMIDYCVDENENLSNNDVKSKQLKLNNNNK